MRRFKSLAASALTVAATLSFSVLSAPAHADIKWNGPTLNGPVLNGIRWNGPILQGVELNGLGFNGVSLQGIKVNGLKVNGSTAQGAETVGAQSGRIVAVSLPGGEVIDLR